MSIYFITGFPGFLAVHLVKELRKQNPSAFYYLLVQEGQLEKAQLVKEDLQLLNAQLVEGDITMRGLGIDPVNREVINETVTHVFHLAAIYDLAVPADIAWRTNVEGTSHVVELCEDLSNLKRFIYFSTAFVSGNREETIYEHELSKGQAFKNHYEHTKYEAEVIVEHSSLPVTIVRPGIVIGDSKTGETSKFDGPYYILRFFDQVQRLPIPFLGKGDAFVNLVPVDFVISATTYLAHCDEAVNQTFHLTDPAPYPAKKLYEMFCELLLHKKPSWILPKFVVLNALSVKSLRKRLDVVKETIDYFECNAHYDSTRSSELLSSVGITCPDLKTYIEEIVHFYVRNRIDDEKKQPVQ
ncbi:SDR family oxidoreductase [Pseudalkalibacillus hwajinpoensis]|uniref:SDR family oxidoreductase n=1 Tax=Guptibacillus hwajinpoensis TaxID=208199 RepID=A0A4U1MDL5_9BACL|nr:SDR family oxidoreductase [Pseudalkalibacillus hwajinpoensis]TKD68833.1 SDR family oxidoreductase [Pseudalkalibacillus hwajinpoensis]